MMTYHLITYGCQMNKSDSERINAFLQSNGFKPAPADKAIFLILNLCSVRQSAIDRVWGRINQTKKTNPQAKIILTGCILPADKKKFITRADFILDSSNLSDWLKKIKIKTSKLNQNLKFKIQNSNKSQAFVTIMTGCNNFCSYCAVPYTRGREKSRPAKDIIQEVSTLIIQGYKQIILLGQNVNSYPNFPKLLKKIDALQGDYSLSFISSHPKDISDDLITCFKTLKHLAPHIHFALQSGSDKILKKMNRHYTAQAYYNLTKKLRQAKPGISITTDIIVGFPGETKKDFQATASLMKKIKFDLAYIAQYSPRPGTAAAQLKDSVPQAEKKNREKILNQILRTD